MTEGRVFYSADQAMEYFCPNWYEERRLKRLMRENPKAYEKEMREKQAQEMAESFRKVFEKGLKGENDE